MTACGIQGSVHPPRLENPTKVTDLKAEQIGQSVEVHFTLPELATDGERLTKPLEIDILRSTAPQSSGLSQLPEPAVWIHLNPEKLAPHTQGKDFTYAAYLTDTNYRELRGQTLVIGVRTLTRGFRDHPHESEISNRVDVPIYDVSKPVEGLTLSATETAVELHFSAPQTSLSGGAIQDFAGFRIYRSSTGKPGSFTLLAEVHDLFYRDTSFEFGQPYFYKVRAVFGKPGQLAMSEPSPTREIMPADTFPPAAPEGLSSIYSAGAVELIWTANAEPDLAGYNVYRVEGCTPQRLNKDLLRTPIFRDTTATAGAALNYYVTAVDLSGNESKPSKQETVEAR